MIAAVQADGADIRQEDGGIVGVCLDEIIGNPALAVEGKEDVHDDVQQPARQLQQLCHHVGGVIEHVLPAALVDLLHDGGVQGVDGVLLAVFLVGKSLLGLVLKLLLDHKRDGDVVAHVQAVAGDEAVHARAQDKALDHRGKKDVEVSIFVLRQPLILFGEVGIQRAAVDIDIDMRFIVGAVRHEVGHKLPEGRSLVTQPVAVKAVAALFWSLFHVFSSFQSRVIPHSAARANSEKI